MRLALALRCAAAAGIDWGEMPVLTMTHADAHYLRDQLAVRDIPLGDLRTWDG